MAESDGGSVSLDDRAEPFVTHELVAVCKAVDPCRVSRSERSTYMNERRDEVSIEMNSFIECQEKAIVHSRKVTECDETRGCAFIVLLHSTISTARLYRGTDLKTVGG